MTTTFDEWLRRLRAARKGPVEFQSASRGRLWKQAIRLPGNWTGATVRAQVRLYPDAPSAPLATCSVTGPFIEGLTSVFVLQLAAGSGSNSTGAMPVDPDGSGAVDLAIDVLLTPAGGEEDLLFGGTLSVLGRVTA